METSLQRTASIVALSAFVASCAPAGAPPRHFPATGNSAATLVFDLGDAPAGAFDYIGERLASDGVSVTFASGAAWKKAAIRAMSDDTCMLFGAYGAAAPRVAALAQEQGSADVDGMLLIGGLVGPRQNLNRAGFPSAHILAGADASTKADAVTAAQARSTDPASFSVIEGVDNQAFLNGDAARRKEIADFAAYDVRWMCGKRIERAEKMEELRRWEESQGARTIEPATGPAP